MGRRRIGPRALRAPSPLITPPTSRFTKQQQLPCSPATWPGGTLQEKKKQLTCPFWGRKKFGSQPLPRYSAQADSWGAGPPERARSALCSELGTEGEGKRGGWAPTSAPPPPALRPDSMLAAPPCTGDAHSPRRRLDCPSPGPGVPARTNFLRVASPTRPTVLARPGVTDASETDFPLFQRKGELARAPQPSSLGPRPRPPPPAVTRRPPVQLGRRGGGSRRLATCTFETKQTRSPRAHPAAGHRPLSPRLGFLGADSPPKDPGRTHSPGHPAPELSGRDSHTPPGSHTHCRTRRDDAPSPAPPPQETFQVVRAPPPSSPALRRPALTFPGDFPAHAAAMGCGTARPGRGAPGERAAYLPGLTPA